MARSDYTFTSESVSEGHPDKVCDRISDAVLDALIAVEPEARVACETFATTNQVVIGGEIGLSDPSTLAGMIAPFHFPECIFHYTGHYPTPAIDLSPRPH